MIEAHPILVDTLPFGYAVIPRLPSVCGRIGVGQLSLCFCTKEFC
jgi:hypothetical protein